MIEQLYKVSIYCLDDHVVKKEKLEAVPICVLANCLTMLAFGANW